MGIIYSPEIEPLVQSHGDLIQVLEVEPQTLWMQISAEGEARYKTPDGLVNHLADLPGRKLIHSVGGPVGGSLPPAPVQLDLVRQWVDRLDAPWASEHLAFNATLEFHAGFFLAPRQTPDGVETVVNSIRRFKKAMPVPVAVETGVGDLLRFGQMAVEAGHHVHLDKPAGASLPEFERLLASGDGR